MPPRSGGNYEKTEHAENLWTCPAGGGDADASGGTGRAGHAGQHRQRRALSEPQCLGW